MCIIMPMSEQRLQSKGSPKGRLYVTALLPLKLIEPKIVIVSPCGIEYPINYVYLGKKEG